jgi:putative PEP-CTERM system TPR-repeat lipoprotein
LSSIRYTRAVSGLVTFVCLGCAFGDLAAAPAASIPSSAQLSQVERLLADAENAEKSGNFNLALIQLKNAALLEPSNGEIGARLGLALLHSGQAINAERELRQALRNLGPSDLIVPGILGAMLQRKKLKELLAEFPDPAPGTEDKTTPAVLSARAQALQMLGQAKDARAAVDHSLALRRDADGLISSAKLAQQQGDLALAASQAAEAIRLSPANEAAWILKISLAGASGDLKTALATADDFVRRSPQSSIAKVIQIEVLLALKEDARAKEAVSSLLKAQPKSVYGQYFSAVLLLRARDNAGAWRLAQNLPAPFVQSRAPIARMVAAIASASGNLEAAGAILTQLVARTPDDRLARLQLAMVRLSQKSPKDALITLDPLKKSNDPTTQAVLAQTYLALGQFAEAISSLEIANSAPRANPLIEQELAFLELRGGEGDRALEELRASATREPDNLQLSAVLIGALQATRKWDEALAVADRMARTAPASPLPDFYRGQTLMARGNLTAAAAEFGKSIAHDPKFLAAAYYRASAFAGLGEFEQAKKDLQLIINQQPTNWLAWSKLTQIAIQNGQHEQALALFDQAIKAAPNDPVPRLGLAKYLVARGKLTEAEATVTALRQIAKDNPDVLALQGEIQLARGQTSQAVLTFRLLTTGNRSSPAAYELLARALYDAKDLPAAEGEAKKAAEVAPNSPEASRALVAVQIDRGNGDSALATAQAFTRANPGPDADLLVADTLIRLKRLDQAEALLDKSLAAKPDSRVATRLSQIAIQSGNPKKAKTVLENWITKNPDDFEMRGRYAGWLMSSGDSAGARTAYEALLKLRPNDPVALNNLATVLQKDDSVRALALAAAAAKIVPQSAAIADTLGWIKYLRGDQRGAFPVLQHAHDLESTNPAISFHFAVALRANGKPAEAKTLLQTTLAKNPKFDGAGEAKELLARW